eukprot:6197196-Pleurochrysis_carterae.AAC.1
MLTTQRRVMAGSFSSASPVHNASGKPASKSEDTSAVTAMRAMRRCTERRGTAGPRVPRNHQVAPRARSRGASPAGCRCCCMRKLLW